jgi:hypothetical protein
LSSTAFLRRKLDPETSISIPVPTRVFHRASDYSHAPEYALPVLRSQLGQEARGGVRTAAGFGGLDGRFADSPEVPAAYVQVPKAGNKDVVQTLDAAKHPCANLRRFLNYFNLCLGNKFRTMESARMKNPLCHTVRSIKESLLDS